MASLQSLTGGGAFTRQNATQINNNFTALNTVDFWVRPQKGNNNGNGSVVHTHGSYDNAFATMTGVSRYWTPGIVVGLEGVLLEEFSMPTGVNDITILGMGNQPRQATTSGVANGGGATWLSPSGGTGALLTLNGQATTVKNIFFNNSATANPCILLTNTGDGPALANAEHTVIDGCIFTGTDDGVKSTGLPNWVTIQNSKFFGFSGSGDLAISYTVGAGTGTLLGWSILNNQFLGNAGHITAGLASAEIAYNHFSYIWGAVTSTTQVVLTGGANNSVHHNTFDVPNSQNGITAMFAEGTNDRWMNNTMGTAVTTTLTRWGVPAS